MLWIWLAVGSYFFSAISQIVDKILLRSRIPSAATYAFYTGLTSALVAVLIPFAPFSDFLLPFATVFFALVAGVVFIPAIYFLYTSLIRCDVSRIVPMIGAAIPIFLVLLGVITSKGTIQQNDLFAVLFFIFGGLILALEVEQTVRSDSLVAHLLGASGHRLQICSYETGRGIGAALLSAFFFALTFFLSKEVYNAPSAFIPEFFWMRMGSVMGALGMLLLPILRRNIFATTPTMSQSSAGILFGNKLIGASSFLLLNLSFNVAASQNQVILINAMKGIEHFFVFLLALGFTLFSPGILSEAFDRHTLILKLLGMLLIAIGFWYLP